MGACEAAKHYRAEVFVKASHIRTAALGLAIVAGSFAFGGAKDDAALAKAPAAVQAANASPNRRMRTQKPETRINIRAAKAGRWNG